MVVVIALLRVFALRRRYVQALLDQAQHINEALRQHRRLAGTLFHDVSNHLQVITLALPFVDSGADLEHAQSLSQRIHRLITLSKEFLLDPELGSEPKLSAVRVSRAVELLNEAFGPRPACRCRCGSASVKKVPCQPKWAPPANKAKVSDYNSCASTCNAWAAASS